MDEPTRVSEDLTGRTIVNGARPWRASLAELASYPLLSLLVVEAMRVLRQRRLLSKYLVRAGSALVSAGVHVAASNSVAR